ncbi:hypothetical protein VYU27_009458, partial [Nannochloropsis oceanica]
WMTYQHRDRFGLSAWLRPRKAREQVPSCRLSREDMEEEEEEEERKERRKRRKKRRKRKGKGRQGKGPIGGQRGAQPGGREEGAPSPSLPPSLPQEEQAQLAEAQGQVQALRRQMQEKALEAERQARALAAAQQKAVQASHGGANEQLLRSMKEALSAARVQNTSLQLQVNYYDSELHRERTQHSQEKAELLSRQRHDLSTLFSMMVAHSPCSVREALTLTPSEPRAVLGLHPPFSILHVNKSWSSHFHWDAHEIVGNDLDFFKGVPLEGLTSWKSLLESVGWYGYAAADVLIQGGGDTFFVQSLLITPLIEARNRVPPSSSTSPPPPTRPPLPPPIPLQGGRGREGGKEGGPGTEVVRVGHLVRSSVRKVPELTEDMRQALRRPAPEALAVVDPPLSEGRGEEGREEGVDRTSLSGLKETGDEGAACQLLLMRCQEQSLMQNLWTLRELGNEFPLFLVDQGGRLLSGNLAFSVLTQRPMREMEGLTLEALLALLLLLILPQHHYEGREGGREGGREVDWEKGWEARLRESADRASPSPSPVVVSSPLPFPPPPSYSPTEEGGREREREGGLARDRLVRVWMVRLPAADSAYMGCLSLV